MTQVANAQYAVPAAELPGASEYRPANGAVGSDGGQAAHAQPRWKDFVLSTPGEPPQRGAARQQRLEHGKGTQKHAGGDGGSSGHDR